MNVCSRNLSKKNTLLHAAAVLLALLLCGALSAGTAAADAEYIDTSDFATGYIEPEKPILLPMDAELIASESEPDLEMTERFSRITGNDTSDMQSNVMMTKSLQNLKAETYPSKFDLRSRYAVTSVKDQGNYGTCWAFSSTAAVESSTVINGYETAASADFSETQLAYFTYNRNGVTKGSVPSVFTRVAGDDLRITSGEPFYDFGGNTYMTGHTLMTGIGVTRESYLPYSQITSSISASKAYDNNEYTVVGTYIISISDKNTIKSQLMHTGCGVINYYASIAAYGPNSDGSYSYYNSVERLSNHAVTLVGWDDNYPVTNFKSTNRPSSPGAWLIKNSWGDTEGQNGYFWISYEDKSLDDVTFFEVIPSEYIDTIYQYDGGAYPGGYYNGVSGKYYLARFANQFNADADQWITAVAFELFDTDLSSNININVAVWNTTNECYSDWQVIPTTLGYYTVYLPVPVYVTAGERFGVNVYVKSLSPVYVGADVSYSATNEEYVSCNLDKQSYAFNFDTNKWVSLSSDKNRNYRIKAYGVNASQSGKSVSLSSGWNFIAVSEPFEDDSAETVFKDLDSESRSPLWYDASVQEWKLVKKTDSISSLEGYYVYSDSADTIDLGKQIPRTYYMGTAEPDEKTISPGWNAVGLGSGVPYSAEKYLSGVSSWTNITYDGVTYEHGTAISPANDRLLPVDTPMWLYADGSGSIQEAW